MATAMFDVLHGLRGKILALCLGSLTLLGLTMGAAGVYAVVQAAEAVQPDVRATSTSRSPSTRTTRSARLRVSWKKWRARSKKR